MCFLAFGAIRFRRPVPAAAVLCAAAAPQLREPACFYIERLLNGGKSKKKQRERHPVVSVRHIISVSLSKTGNSSTFSRSAFHLLFLAPLALHHDPNERVTGEK